MDIQYILSVGTAAVSLHAAVPASSTDSTELFSANTRNSKSSLRYMEALSQNDKEKLTAAFAVTTEASQEIRPNHPYVGVLGERWEFPSDHLPVGVTIDGFHLVTWNVLNTIYMDWIYTNDQGLAKSLIAAENVPMPRSSLTIREAHVLEDVLSMINHPTHPRSVLCLQECGGKFLNALTEALPENFKVITTYSKSAKDENVIIYDSNLFDCISSERDDDAYPCNPGRALLNAVLQKKDTGIKYQIFNAHVPGDPNLPGRYEFASYIAEHARKDAVTLGLGDMNFEADEMQDAFEKAGIADEFMSYSPYNTNIGLDLCGKTIDHIFIRGTSAVTGNAPNEVIKGLQQIVDLFQEQEAEAAFE